MSFPPPSPLSVLSVTSVAVILSSKLHLRSSINKLESESIFSDTDTPNSYGVECLLRLKGVQVTQIYTDLLLIGIDLNFLIALMGLFTPIIKPNDCNSIASEF